MARVAHLARLQQLVRMECARAMSSSTKSQITVNSACSACSGLQNRLSRAEVADHSAVIPEWVVNSDCTLLSRAFKLKSFQAAMSYVNQVADVAEAEGHHPDIHITDYNRVRVDLSTHKVGGITENDVIMAVKLDALSPPRKPVPL